MQRLCSTAGLVTIQAVAVQHCADAWAFVLRHADGWSLCYSGDTRPCGAVEVAAKDCTLLIHEATFDTTLQHQVLTLQTLFNSLAP